MCRKSKVTKKVVGSAHDSAARGEGEDGSSGGFALEGMGLQALPTGAVGGSGEENTSAEATVPPAHSMLDDVTSQPAEADPSVGGTTEGGETATVSLTLEQQGAATREAFQKDARTKRAAALKAAGDEQRAERLLRRGGAAPGEGVVERTGLGIGYGVFDAVYEPPAEEMPMARYGRNYAESSRWTDEVAQDWQARMSGLRDEWGCQKVTVRLFKASW